VAKALRFMITAVLAALLLASASCTKTCARCGGSGETVVTESCPKCSGTGSVRAPCAKCGGKGKMEAGSSCPYCNGTGLIVCSYRTGVPDPGNTCYIPSRSYAYPTVVILCVKGRLQPLDPANESKMMRLLRNNPNRICPRCAGTGQFACSYCSGKGILTGVLVCSACNGQGETIAKCPECKGLKTVTKKAPCPICGGVGTVHRLFG
jgi:DnaJ-class molecular chaperone